MSNPNAKRAASSDRHEKAKRTPPLKKRRWPKSDWESELARLGYWAGLVQKAVKKWSPRIGEDFCKGYMVDCAFSVRAGSDAVNVKLKATGHIGYVLELLSALHQIHNDPENLDRWLLELATSGHEYVRNRPALPGYKELLMIIKRRGGLKTLTPTENALAQRARRLRLT